MSKLSQVVTICFLLLIQYGYSLTLNKAFPWIDIDTPAIGQSIDGFEDQFPEVEPWMLIDEPSTEAAKLNRAFMVDSPPVVTIIRFTDGYVSSLTYGITGQDFEDITRKHRSELKKLYGEPELLETGQVDDGVVHPVNVELYAIDDPNDIKAKLLATSRGFQLTLFDESVSSKKNRPIVRSVDEVRKSIKRLGISPDGEKTIIDYVAQLRAEEAGEAANRANTDNEDVDIEEGIVSETAPPEDSPALSAEKDFDRKILYVVIFAVIILITIFAVVKMRKSN